MRSCLNLEKQHVEALLQLVQQEMANPTINHGSTWYLEVLLKEALDNIDKGM